MTLSPDLMSRSMPPDPGLELMLMNGQDVPTEQKHAPMDAAREAELRRLLDPPQFDHKGNSISYGNYEYARDSGLLDEFAYDPERHYDGLMHILVGQAQTDKGRSYVGGFHVNHDPGYVRTAYGSYEDRSQIPNLSPKHRKQYVDRPYEPRKARVVVSGHEKNRVVTDEQGINHVAVVGSTMFPHEYDPIAVMQAIRIAKQTRDRSKDERHDDKINARGQVPLIDGKTMMDVCLVLTPDEKVITAYPRVKESGYMKLSETAINQALGLSEAGK